MQPLSLVLSALQCLNSRLHVGMRVACVMTCRKTYSHTHLVYTGLGYITPLYGYEDYRPQMGTSSETQVLGSSKSTRSRSPAVFLLDVCERGAAACLYLGTKIAKKEPRP